MRSQEDGKARRGRWNLPRLPSISLPAFSPSCSNSPGDALQPRLVARIEDDRVNDSHDAALGLRERQIPEPANHARDDSLIRDVRPSVRGGRHAPRPVDDELYRHATRQVRIRSETILVTEAETTEVLAHD